MIYPAPWLPCLARHRASGGCRLDKTNRGCNNAWSIAETQTSDESDPAQNSQARRPHFLKETRRSGLAKVLSNRFGKRDNPVFGSWAQSPRERSEALPLPFQSGATPLCTASFARLQPLQNGAVKDFIGLLKPAFKAIQLQRLGPTQAASILRFHQLLKSPGRWVGFITQFRQDSLGNRTLTLERQRSHFLDCHLE